MDIMMGIAAANNLKLAAWISCTRIPLNSRVERLIWTGLDQAKQARLAILDAILNLNETEQAIILARFGEELSLQACGDRMGNRSRERIRQIEARAIRRLRMILRKDMALLREAVAVVPVPGGPYDPAWITTKQAAELTELTRDHIRYLCREQKISSRRNPFKGGFLQIYRASLKSYVHGQASHGRRRGIWKGDNSDEVSSVRYRNCQDHPSR